MNLTHFKINRLGIGKQIGRPYPPNATPEELEDIQDEHELLLQKHAVELATARAKCLAQARTGRPPSGVPSISCEIEYMSFKDKAAAGSAGAGAGAGKGGAARRGKKGILTIFINRAININDLPSKVKPKPAATVICAGQSYTTVPMKDKTNKPLWDETFIFFNVADTAGTSADSPLPPTGFTRLTSRLFQLQASLTSSV